LQLPHRWWLLGVDVQLESDIDEDQLRYFRDFAAAELKAGDQVIVASAEPDWIYGDIYDRRAHKNLAELERDVVAHSGAQIRVRLAGDLHHYQRHASADGQVHNITAGGGGAFLHPTHGYSRSKFTVERLDSAGKRHRETYSRKAVYPTPARSAALTTGNLLFPLFNLFFGAATGLLYALLSSAMPRPDSAASAREVLETALQ